MKLIVIAVLVIFAVVTSNADLQCKYENNIDLYKIKIIKKKIKTQIISSLFQNYFLLDFK